MFKDSDFIIFTCPHCGQDTEKEIRWLKTRVSDFPCDHCASQFGHDPEHFVRVVLEEAARPGSKLSHNMRRV